MHSPIKILDLSNMFAPFSLARNLADEVLSGWEYGSPKRLMRSHPVALPVGEERIHGDLQVPLNSRGLDVFAHGSGSSRHSPRNQLVANTLNRGGIATLLIDLLTASEEAIDNRTAQLRFNIPFLADRLVRVTDWVGKHPYTATLTVGYFGASTGAAAALLAATDRPDVVKAIVSRGGRPELAAPRLEKVRAPTLLIVGGNDPVVIQLNYQAAQMLRAPCRIEILPGAGHLFEEPGMLAQVAQLALDWFEKHLVRRATDAA
jgi:putative phosphoribosyl transferase